MWRLKTVLKKLLTALTASLARLIRVGLVFCEACISQVGYEQEDEKS